MIIEKRLSRSFLLALLLGKAAMLPCSAVAADAKASKADGDELHQMLSSVDKLWFSNRDTADMTMSVKTAHYERTLKLTYWTQGSDQAMIKITFPPAEKGTVTLRLGSDIYNYLPNVDRTVKVSAALRSSGWMGSHFSNDDLVHSASLSRDFDGTIVEAKKKGNVTIWTVDLIPKKNAAVVWSKVRMVVEKERKIPLTQVFYDEQGAKAKTLVFSDLKQLGGRLVPSKISVIPADLPGEHTDLVYEAIRHNMKFEGDFFTLERLKSL